MRLVNILNPLRNLYEHSQTLPLGTTPGKEDDSREGGGSERLEHVLEVENVWNAFLR